MINLVKCEVVSVSGEKHCNGAAQMMKGKTFVVGLKTPEPNGLCAKAFAALYPVITAMQFSKEVTWEKGRGYCEIICPDGKAVFRLTRVKN